MRRVAMYGCAISFVAACSAFGTAPASDAGTSPGTDGATDAKPGDGSTSVDAGVEAAPPIVCDGGPGCDRLVFVTSITTQGNFGGIDSADTTCQNLAKKASIAEIQAHAQTRKFKALLAADGANAFERFTTVAPYYLAVTPRRLVVASGFSDFTKAKDLVNAIDADENGVGHTGERVWTGTTPGGQAGSDCLLWMSNSASVTGLIGDTAVAYKSGGWIGRTNEGCDRDNRFYCVEE